MDRITNTQAAAKRRREIAEDRERRMPQGSVPAAKQSREAEQNAGGYAAFQAVRANRLAERAESTDSSS